MSVVTVVWSMIAAACLTLAAVHLPVWWRNRQAKATLAFALAAVSTAGLACFELRMLKAQTTGEFAMALKLVHVPIVLLLLALAGFAYHYLNAGWRWLAIGGIGLRMVSVVLNFSTGVNLNFLEISSLHSVPLLGEAVAAADGVPNPAALVGQLGIGLLTLFFVGATVTAWRRGRRVAALSVGGSLSFLMIAGFAQGILMTWLPVSAGASTISLFALSVVAIMGYALSVDLLRAQQLVVALAAREEEVNLAAEAANLGIWTRDIVSDTISASRKWRELFGFTPGERITTGEVLQRIHVGDRAAFAERFTLAGRARGDYQSEFLLELPDGRKRWIAVLGRVEFDHRGKALRSRGACIDISARKQAEQEMLRLRQDIAHVSRVSVMGQLSSALAHEINQPLGAILRNAEAAALFMQQPTPDLHEISAILEDIRKDDQRASDVIDRIRALLRHEEVAMTLLDVRQILGDVATLLRPDAAARHVALALDVPQDLPSVRGDRVQIQQVLLNLILNGMDAFEGLGERSRSVRVTARRDDAGTVEISVVDGGRGIAADQFGRIFDPFFTTKAKGIGMGLAISRSIVEMHGGRLWAESNVDAGATFRFTLPIATSARKSASSVDESEVGSASAITPLRPLTER